MHFILIFFFFGTIRNLQGRLTIRPMLSSMTVSIDASPTYLQVILDDLKGLLTKSVEIILVAGPLLVACGGKREPLH